jgi:hypothetical protein
MLKWGVGVVKQCGKFTFSNPVNVFAAIQSCLAGENNIADLPWLKKQLVAFLVREGCSSLSCYVRILDRYDMTAYRSAGYCTAVSYLGRSAITCVGNGSLEPEPLC